MAARPGQKNDLIRANSVVGLCGAARVQFSALVVINRNIVSLILRGKKKPEAHILNRSNSNFDAQYQIRCELSLDVCVVCGVAQRFNV
jgi:hypothetical protein